MPDPFTLSVLGAAAATEGIKFLYGQASDLLKAWRDRRKDGGGPTELAVPIRSSKDLEGTPTQMPPDPAIVEQHLDELIELSAKLSSYDAGHREVDVDDAALAEAFARLRSLLEAIYHQRLTFDGEQRPATGTEVTVNQVIDELYGSATGMNARVRAGAHAHVDQAVKSLMPGAELKGYEGEVG
jgi:hypothetical protein